PRACVARSRSDRARPSRPAGLSGGARAGRSRRRARRRRRGCSASWSSPGRSPRRTSPCASYTRAWGGEASRGPNMGGMSDSEPVLVSDEGALRDQAVASIKRKQAFKQMLVGYVIINALLIGIWAISGGGYFWPAWVLGGWGIGLLFSGWS